MGQHLQVYASDNVSLEDAKEWCRYRSVDLIEMPTKIAEEVGHKMFVGSQARVDKLEHGSKRAVVVFDRIVWSAHVIDSALLYALAKDALACDLPSSHMFEFLQQRIGWIVWGDNDGV